MYECVDERPSFRFAVSVALTSSRGVQPVFHEENDDWFAWLIIFQFDRLLLFLSVQFDASL